MLVLGGFLIAGPTLHEFVLVERLAEHFTVVTVERLSHGSSDAPTDPSRYTLEAQADDAVAVMDALGWPAAHVFGYSMGAWQASGVALHHPDRIDSLVVGGWTPARLARPPVNDRGQKVGADVFVADVRDALEGIGGAMWFSWVTPDRMGALRMCFDTFFEDQRTEAADAVAALGGRTLVWNGVDDPTHPDAEVWATEHEVEYLDVPGDHVLAFFQMASDPSPLLRFLGRVTDDQPLGQVAPGPSNSPRMRRTCARSRG
jgi:pimeloyl-ACP methyl ester carboxylesterase